MSCLPCDRQTVFMPDWIPGVAGAPTEIRDWGPFRNKRLGPLQKLETVAPTEISSWDPYRFQ